LNKTSIGHDFKNTRRRKRDELAFSKEFFTGLAVGLIVAVGVYIWQRQTIDAIQAGVVDTKKASAPSQSTIEPEASQQPTPVFDFPTVLPIREVVIVEQGTDGDSSPVPSAPVLRPGAYVLHLGIFGESNQAEALKARLLRVGLQPEIQNITVDGEIQYRVRIGVISDLGELNRIRSLLQRSEIETEVVRVSDF